MNKRVLFLIKFIGTYLLLYFVFSNFLAVPATNFYKNQMQKYIGASKGDMKIQYKIEKEPKPFIIVGLMSDHMLETAKAKAIKKGLTKVDVSAPDFNIHVDVFFLLLLYFFLALWVAYPQKWQSRIATLIIGLFLLHLFFYIKTENTIFYYKHQFSSLGYELDKVWAKDIYQTFFELRGRVGFNLIVSAVCFFIAHYSVQFIGGRFLTTKSN